MTDSTTTESREIHVVDVFAESKYAGNQLAVILDAKGLSSEQMQAIARETNFSETTFVDSRQPRDGGYDVRIFTPRAELPFAGHPTLGTAWVIQRYLLGGVGERVVLNLKVGPIPVRFERDESGPPVLWMRQRPPVFGAELTAAEVAPVVGLAAADLDPGHPPQVVSTGVPTLVVPAASLEAVQRARVDPQRYDKLCSWQEGGRLVQLFARQAATPDHDLHVRVFAPYFGVPEDPATGSAAGCLAGYLVHRRVLGGSTIDVKAEQGGEMGRPSLLRLAAREDGDEIEVRVGGRVIPTMRGELV